jgi:glycerol 3-phosphatase-2
MKPRGVRQAPTAAGRQGEAVISGPVLALRYDALFIDLDGVVYRGDHVLPAAPEVLDRVRAQNVKVLFLTNNSARTPQQVADRLQRLGVRAEAREILTSALATASMLRREGATGRKAYVIGERGVREALEEVGIEILDEEAESADLVVVGWDRSADYAKLRRASLLVQRGARLIATNGDASYPAPDGLWPGAGALLSAVTTTTGAVPTIVGKPSRPLFQAAAGLTGASRPLVVGDRLDTDVEGARAMGWDSLLVLTGASTPADLLQTTYLPTYVAGDLSGVLDDLPPGRFRRAGLEDAGPIRSLLEESGLQDDGVEERIEGTIVSSGITGSGKIDATACLQREDGFGILRSIAVRKPLQGKGLGMLAVAAAMAPARAGGIRNVSLFTETAAGFFERLGFRRVDRGELPEPVRRSAHAAEECPATAAALVRDL